jgi:HAD superfamily hydrolase (TIGR01509 family)
MKNSPQVAFAMAANPGIVARMKFAAVLFDFDGVLVDTEMAIYQAWRRTFLAHGHDLPLTLYTRCIGSDFDTWSPKTHLEDLTGRGFDWHQLDAERQVEIHRDLADAGPMPGAASLLAALAARAMPRAVVSSSSHSWVDGWLGRLDLARNVPLTICRGDAPRIKPAPDLFLEAASRLGVAPADCLVIEDSANGLQAATAAGMTTWVVPNDVTRGLDFGKAARVLASLDEAATLLGC